MSTTKPEAHRVAAATAEIRADRYHVDLHTGHHRLAADETTAHGGADTGPSPFDLLLSGLGACTAITLRMYADRKGWPLAGVQVALAYERAGDAGRITRHIRLDGDLDKAQRDRLADIAERTPVTRAVKEGLAIDTTTS